jgi:[ribosomal protein S5]-alanine N-acetyltransferase
MTADFVLATPRLSLRPYTEADIAELVPLIGAREIAATTLRIPHPYTEQNAREFLELIRDPQRLWLAITLRDNGRQIGGIGLTIDEQHRRAELGYWLGVEYWGRGYVVEAAREMVRYGFENRQLHRIFASHFKHNPASARVLKKLGMRYEGRQREHYCKWGQLIDSELYGILRHEWSDGAYNG